MPLRTLNIRAWIDKNIFGRMIEESTRWIPKETGGILMGYWANREEVVVTNIIGPGDNSVHNWYSFTPDAKWQENEIARIYRESGRVITYLGDWHSHPYGSKKLSNKDILVLHRTANYRPARTKLPIMGIIWNLQDWKLSVWCYSLRGAGNPIKQTNIIWWDPEFHSFNL